MKKFALAVLIGVGALAFAGTAQGKELQSLKICGVNGCKETTDRDALRGWEVAADPDQVSSPTPAGYYRVDIAFGEGGNILHRDTAYWLPGRDLMRYQGQAYDPWWKLFPSQHEMMQKLAAGIDPFVPRLARVRVAGRVVADPDSYLRLFKEFRYAYVPSHAPKFVRIVLRAAEPNPWVKRRVVMRYAPKTRLLIRPDGYYKLPKALARKLMRRLSLEPSGSAAALYAGVGAGVGALVVLGLAGSLVRKKRSNS
jgi:hypothetical protein